MPHARTWSKTSFFLPAVTLLYFMSTSMMFTLLIKFNLLSHGIIQLLHGTTTFIQFKHVSTGLALDQLAGRHLMGQHLSLGLESLVHVKGKWLRSQCLSLEPQPCSRIEESRHLVSVDICNYLDIVGQCLGFMCSNTDQLLSTRKCSECNQRTSTCCFQIILLLVSCNHDISSDFIQVMVQYNLCEAHLPSANG